MYNSFVAMSGDPYASVKRIQEQGLDISLGVSLPLKYAEKKLADARQAAQAYHEELASYKRATYNKACLRYGEIEAQRLGYTLPKPFNPARWMRIELDQMVGAIFELSTSPTERGTPRVSGKVHSAFVRLGKAFDVLGYQEVFDNGTREVVWWDLHSYAAVEQTDRVELPEEATSLLKIVTTAVQVPYDGEQSTFYLSTVLEDPPYPTPWLDESQTYTSE